MSKELLIETMPVALTILEESSSKNGGRMKVKGIFTVADEINGNGRVYREHIIDREIEKLKPMMAENRVYGEADHPGDGKSTIKNTAAMLTGIDKQMVDGRKIYVGEAIVLNTEPGGKNLQEIIRAGGRIGVSSRAFGSLLKGNWQGKTADIVQEDLTLKTFDFVIGQSTKDAEISQVTEQMKVVNILECDPDGHMREDREKQTTKGGSSNMEIKNVEELRKAYPDLCEQLIKDAVEKKEKEVKETLQKDFDARILKEVEAKKEEVKKEVIEEVKNSEEFKGMVGTFVEIGKLIKPYISEGALDDDEDELAEKVGELEGKVSNLEAENKALKEQMENEKKAVAEKEKVQKRVQEVTAGKQHEKLLAEALADCKTVEEVDKKVVAEEARIQKLIEELDPKKEKARGKGQVLNEDKLDEMDEKKRRERQIAGVDEDLARKKSVAGTA